MKNRNKKERWKAKKDLELLVEYFGHREIDKIDLTHEMIVKLQNHLLHPLIEKKEGSKLQTEGKHMNT